MAKLQVWSRGREFALGGALPEPPENRSGGSQRRRIIVFSTVFLVAGGVALADLIFRPVDYRAEARLEIVPASGKPPSEDRSAVAPAKNPLAEHNSPSFLREVQVLTSRPLLEEVVARLKSSGYLPEDLGADPVSGVQRMLDAQAVEGTQVVELQAQGPDRAFLPRLVNTLTDAYQERLAADYDKSAGTGDTQLRDEVEVLDRQVAAKRQEAEAFRSRYDIVSAERDENQLLSTVKGLGEALNKANSDVAAAEGRLRAVRNAISAGDALGGAKDNPTVADLERRTSQLREQLHDIEQRFTPQYLQLDPAVKALRGRLESLEQQTRSERAAGQRAALAEAQEKLTGAREAADQLQQQLNDNKRALQAFMARFNEYKAMQQDLDHLEQLHRGAMERLAKLEASVSENAPRVEVLEAAAVPQEPTFPLYARAGIGAGGSLALGFLAVWFVEFFARRGPAPQSTMSQPFWPMPLDLEAVAAQRRLLAPEPIRLAAPDAPLRELAEGETAALLRAATDDGRLVLVALLSGLTTEEIIALAWEQIDLDAGAINLPGKSARLLPLTGPLRKLLGARRATQPRLAGTVLHDACGVQLTADDIAALVMCAAYDAGIDGADEVTPRTLRHTYVAYLLRQGVRFADLGHIVGRLPQEEMAAYMRLASPQARVPLAQIDPVLPGLRETAGPLA